MKNFLKRFEKLENIPADNLIKEGLFVSKRFERLEIGDKKIEFTLTDTISKQEQAPPEVIYYFYCPYCGKANVEDSKTCNYCKHSLETELAENFQEKAKLLKRCSCGAMNRQERKNCWICGKTFSADSIQEISPEPKKSENVITLNIDGQEYRSTDTDLPIDIALLMSKIRKEGYSEELINEWLREKNKGIDTHNKSVDRQLDQIRLNLIVRSIGLIIFLIFLFSQFRACSHYVMR